MRKGFNMNLANLDRLCVLIHGGYGTGKTHLQGDFLRWAAERGPVRFLNIAGEDGHSSLAGMQLGEVGETVDSVTDYYDAIREYAEKGFVGVAIDSLSAFYQLMLKHILKGEVRYPDPKIDGERAKMLWGQLAMQTAVGVRLSRGAAPYVLWVSPFDRSDDPVGGGKGITPDLPGKLAYGCAGWFDFVGYLSAATVAADRVERKVTFAPAGNLLTRQRIPRAITQDISIPKDKGGWTAIFSAMQAAMAPVPTSSGGEARSEASTGQINRRSSAEQGTPCTGLPPRPTTNPKGA